MSSRSVSIPLITCSESGEIVRRNDQYLMMFVEDERILRYTDIDEDITDYESHYTHQVTRIIFLDPFQQPKNIIRGVVEAGNFCAKRWYVSQEVYSSASISKITGSQYGFVFQGKVYHLPVPPQVQGEKFETLTEGMDFFFKIGDKTDSLYPKSQV